MIGEEATFKKFGYYSRDWAPKSHKKVVAVCDDCGKVRIIEKKQYRARCHLCAEKGENNGNWKGKVRRICVECGVVFPVFPSKIKQGRGKFCSTPCHAKWLSKHQRGENHPNWQGGISFEPYCIKFNNEFKEGVRDKFDRLCFLCGKTEEDNGQCLSVHHVNGNKNCGCDGDKTCQFVPLCRSCHGKVHSKKIDWEKKIKDKLRTKLNGWYI